MWIDIFKGGHQTDSRGFLHDGDRLIDMAIENFSADGDTVPVVVGHSKRDDKPAFGWVEKLKKEGGKLWAKVRDLNPDFKALIEKKTYPNRSAGFNNGRLDHIAFLGAAAPAVKGLDPVKFSERERKAYFEIEFSEPDPDPASAEADPEPEEKKEEEKNEMGEFTQEQLEAAQKKAAEEAVAKVKAEFAEAEAAKAIEALKKDNSEWLKNVSEGEGAYITPAQRAEFKEFMNSILTVPSFEFSEGAKAPVIIFRELVEKYMKTESGSGEFATKSRAIENKTEWQEIYEDGMAMAGKEIEK